MSKQDLSKSAQKVQRALKDKNIASNVIELPASTRTAQAAADALGCAVGQIVKSLIFCTVDNKPILLLVSGKNRVDEQLIESVVSTKITKADADFTREVTGFAIGGIPPVGHVQPIKTYIDQDLLTFDELWAAAGTPHAVFYLPSKDLVALTDGSVIRVF